MHLQAESLRAGEAYFQADSFALYHGGCLDVLSGFPADSIDMVFADPPYNLSNGGFSVRAGKRVDVHKGDWDQSLGSDRDFDFHCQWIEACRRVLKPAGTIWISGTYHSVYQCGFALQRLGFRILNDISWYKPNAPPNIGCRCFAASHETLIWACKDPKAKYTFHYKDMKHGSWGKDFIKKPDKQMRSVWAVSAPSPSEKTDGRRHPAQKPLELLKRIVRAASNKGDIILDPFSGSATTGIAAFLLQRSFAGIEKEKAFLDLSIRRFQHLNKSLQLELPP